MKCCHCFKIGHVFYAWVIHGKAIYILWTLWFEELLEYNHKHFNNVLFIVALSTQRLASFLIHMEHAHVKNRLCGESVIVAHNIGNISDRVTVFWG